MNPVSPSLNLGGILVKQHEFKKLVNWRRKISPLFLQKNFREKDCCPYETVLFCRSVVSDFATLWTTARQASLSFTIFPEFAQTHVRGVNDAMQPSHHVLLPSPALNLPQHQGLFH